VEEKMTNNNCIKCNAELPSGAKFCPNCAEPVTAEKKQTTSKQKTQIPISVHGLLELLFSKNIIIAGIILGILFAWIGIIILTFSTDTTGFRAASIINSLGLASLSLFLIGGGIANKMIDRYIRIVMIISGSFLLGSSLIISLSTLFSMFRAY
jgi:ribosomal protein L40E